MSKQNSIKAVLISDVHYSLSTLEVADSALSYAVDAANRTGCRLVIMGDLHDTKAVLRGECVKRIMDIISKCNQKPIILRGNHDSINEKSSEHSLEFLRNLSKIVAAPTEIPSYGYFIPYQHDTASFKAYLDTVPKGSQLFIHQGITGENSGDYIRDNSAIPKSWLEGYKVVSGHYHARTDIYVGNPYTLTFGEAKDPEKGYKLLYEDGSTEFVPTNLRKHVILDNAEDYVPSFTDKDIIWVKQRGNTSELAKVTKEKVALAYGIKQPFKLDLIPNKSEATSVSTAASQPEILDSIIVSLKTDKAQKDRLMSLWRQLCG